MEYNYLACDGPNCEQKRDIRNADNNTDAGFDQSQDGGQSEPAVADQQAPAPEEASWFTLDTGAEVFHFCCSDCLTAFVNDPAAPDSSVSRYNEMFGYESNA